MSRLLRQICQLEKLPANKTTEPLTFTECKVELRCKAIVLQSCFRCTRSEVLGLWSTMIGKTEGKCCATK